MTENPHALARTRIIRACIRHEGRLWHAPPPLRHHHVMARMREHDLGVEAMHDQGFLAAEVVDGEIRTNTARFVDRAEAAAIARAAGQLIREPTPPDNLTSEDVW